MTRCDEMFGAEAGAAAGAGDTAGAAGTFGTVGGFFVSSARSEASKRLSCAVRFAIRLRGTVGFVAAWPRWTVRVSAIVPVTAANASERTTMTTAVRDTLFLLRWTVRR